MTETPLLTGRSLAAPPPGHALSLTSAPCKQPRPVVCQLVHTLNVGGAEILARRFAEEAANDYDCVFVCLDSAGIMAQELKRQGYPVEVLDRRPGFDWRCIRRLAAVLNRYEVCLVHAHQYAPFFYACAARTWGRRQIPVLFTEHGRDYPDYRRLKRVLVNRWLLGSNDRIVGVGECVRQALIDFEGLPVQRVEVIYNGIDVAAYDARPAERDSMRSELGLCEDDVAILQVARLNHLKDHATAIRAFAAVAAEHPAARLLIAGDGEERDAIEQLIDSLGLRSRITLLGTRRDVPRLLAAGDLFLLSSISEGIPLTLIEAMAAGLPCVSTDVGGVSEVVVHGQTGLLARAGDSADLAAKLHLLLGDRSLRASLGAAGRVRSREHFSDAVMHAAYQSIYHDLTGSSVANRRRR